MVLPQAHTMKNTYKTKAHITTSRAADVGFFKSLNCLFKIYNHTIFLSLTKRYRKECSLLLPCIMSTFIANITQHKCSHRVHNWLGKST